MPDAPHQLPDAHLSNQDGLRVSLRESLGKFVVIYFYPKASTPGCTQQACLLRDVMTTLIDKGITVFGISPDAPSKLSTFHKNQSLNFDLLSDPEHTLADLFHSWVEKKMYGRTYMGMSRDTFVYDPKGALIASHRGVKPNEHVDLILKSIRS